MNIKVVLRRHAMLFELFLALAGLFILSIGWQTHDLRPGFAQAFWLNLTIDAGVALMATALIKFLLRHFGVREEQQWGLRDVYPVWTDHKPRTLLEELFQQSATVKVLALSASNTLAGQSLFTNRLTERLKLGKPTQFLFASDEEVFRRQREENDADIFSKSRRSLANVQQSANDAGVEVTNHLRRSPAPINANVYLFDGTAFVVPLLTGESRKQSPGLQLGPGILLDRYEQMFDDLWKATSSEHATASIRNSA